MTLYLTKFSFDMRRIMSLHRHLQFSPSSLDTGYLVHCALSQLFHSSAPSVFTVIDSSFRNSSALQNSHFNLQALGYTTVDSDALFDHAKTYAEPDAFNLCDWDKLQSKSMPSEWPSNHVLDFRIRTCPVIRIWRGDETNRRQVERDVWLAKVKTLEEEGVPVTESPGREEVYLQWFQKQMEKRVGIELKHHQVLSYKRDRLIRKTRHSDNSERKSHVLDRPMVIFQGSLQIKDSDSFNLLLKNGLGRHKTFGYGMFLLKPFGSR